jgi:hypothetical protein
MLLSHILKNQLMHFILKLYFLKHDHSSKPLECLCPVLPYMFRSLTLTILRGIVLVALLLSALLLFLGTTLSGHVAVSVCAVVCTLPLLVQLYPVYNWTSSGRVHTTAQTETQPHAQIKLCRGTTTRRTVAV